MKQQELERQGVKLEKTIREVCEQSDRERADAGKDLNENGGRESLGPEVRETSTLHAVCFIRERL